MTIDRHTMLGAMTATLAGGATLNAAAIVTAKAADSATTDPIFAAIEAYKRGLAFHEECLEKAASDHARDYDESWRLSSLGSDTELGALDAMLETVPTTAAGALALVELLLEEAEKEMAERHTIGEPFTDEYVYSFLCSMAEFLRAQS